MKANPLLAGFRWLGARDAHIRQIVALAIAAMVYLFFPQLGHSRLIHFIAIWDVYALILVLMEWITILTGNPRTVQKTARLQDSNRTIIFFCVVAAACFSVVAVISLLQEHRLLHEPLVGVHLAMAVLAVVESWALIHSLFALRYAHIFYRSQGEAKGRSGGGLDFPGNEDPDFLDFAYFSFVIGMTCQVADVNITSRFMRREVLLHGVLAFAFNTIILAVSINILAGLLSV